MKSRIIRALISKLGYFTIFCVLAIFMLNLVVSCSSSPDIIVPTVPVGQVKGSIAFEAEIGDPTEIMLCIKKANGHYDFDLKWQSIIKDTASLDHDFFFEDVPPGEYSLIGFWEKNKMIQNYIIVKDGEIYTFIVPEDRGIDLGYIGFCSGEPVTFSIND